MPFEHPLTDATNNDAIGIYGSYPFATDETYQQGLASILAGGALDGNPPHDVKEEILRRTRVFYFNRVSGHSITMEEAREYEQSARDRDMTESSPSDSVAVESQTSNDDARVLTFAELQELIESGRVDQIPNNKVIPEALNDASPSDSTASAPKKPWETSAAATHD